ncbi:MAG: alpha/beta fold hydrolase [Bacteroidota bacterium]
MTASAPPVVLVHGFLDSPRLFRHMQAHLGAAGHTTHVPLLTPRTARGGLDRLAEHLRLFLDDTFASATEIDLVGFSMGGLIARYYVQRLGGLDRTRRLVTISTPHGGTLWSRLPLNRGIAQMRPGSAFLRDLDRDIDTLADVDMHSIWTPYDLMIVPARSSVLPVGTHEAVPVALHALMARDRRVLDLVSDALA